MSWVGLWGLWKWQCVLRVIVMCVFVIFVCGTSLKTRSCISRGYPKKIVCLYVYIAICRLAENTHDVSIAFIHVHAVVTDRCHVTLCTEAESHFRILMGSMRNVYCTRMRLARKKKYFLF